MTDVSTDNSNTPHSGESFVEQTLGARSTFDCVFGPSPALHLPKNSSGVIHFCPPATSELLYLESVLVSGLFDQGTVKVPEDIAIARPPFFCVLDGTSGVFYPGREPTLYGDGKTGGQLSGDIVKSVIESASPNTTLQEVLSLANDLIAKAHVGMGLNLSQPGTLGGVVGVIAKVGAEQTEIAQWGDCFYHLVTKTGQTFLAENQVFAHDKEMRDVIAQLMIKHHGDRGAMWREFGPLLIEKRNEQINRADQLGYGFLCGQPDFIDRINYLTVPTADVSQLTLFTDGFVFFDESGGATGQTEALGRDKECSTWQTWLQSVLAATREKERAVDHLTHVSHGESAVLSLLF